MATSRFGFLALISPSIFRSISSSSKSEDEFVTRWSEVAIVDAPPSVPVARGHEVLRYLSSCIRPRFQRSA